MPIRQPISRGLVNRAGDVLKEVGNSEEERREAAEVLSNWRAEHASPLNNFQMILRNRVWFVDRQALVAQRLKRISSIVRKLRRFPEMELSRMHDIGGVRAVVDDMNRVRALQDDYENNVRFHHELIREYDYVDRPQSSGYRSLHLIYRYDCRSAPQYHGLLLEMQIRTRQQHAWATAVETVDIFLGSNLKSGEGRQDWKDFFAVTGSAFARLEQQHSVPGYEALSDHDTFREVARQSRELQVREILSGYRMAAKMIHESPERGSYYLLVLNPIEKSLRYWAFAKNRLAEATARYLEAEETVMHENRRQQAVLVATASVRSLKKAYPNFFLDTSRFLGILRKIERLAGPT